MRASTRLGLIAFVVLNCSLPITNARAQTKTTLLSTISGKVTIKDKPAPGVVVALRHFEARMPGQSELLRATTDQDGIYHIKNVPPGSYIIQTTKPAYIVPDPGGRTMNIGEAENIEEINFALVRGGVITGKVTESDGKPVVQEAVNIFKADAFDRPAQEKQMPVNASSVTQTDDRGIYRAFGLPAGKYKVAVGRGDETRTSIFPTPGRNTFRQTFYSNAEDESKATIIELTEGSEANDIDITIGPQMTTFTASGRVTDSESGLPLPDVRFGLQRFRRPQFPEVVNLPALTNKNGEFVIEGLIPGSYAVFLFGDLNPPRRLDAGTFEIVDQNVTGIDVKLSKGTSISGTVVLESADKVAQSKLGQLQIQASIQPSQPASVGSFRSANVSADGSFFLGGLGAGWARFYIGRNNDHSATFSVTRIEREGVIQPQEIEIKEGDQLVGIRIFVTYGNSTLRGVVNLRNGTLPSNAQIFAQLSPTTQPGSNFPLRIDSRGHFVSEGLMPGVYEVRAGVTIPNSNSITTKQQVNIGPGTTDISLTLDLSSLSSPQPQQ